MGKFASCRFGPVKIQKDNFMHIGIYIIQKLDGSVEITQKSFTDMSRPITTSPSIWKGRTRPLDD